MFLSAISLYILLMVKLTPIRWTYLMCIWLSLLVLIQCAHKVAPSGGPEDRTPPTVLSTDPQAFQVNVPLETKIRILFSEKLDANSIQNQVWIIPEPADGYQISVHKNRIEITPQSPLQPNVTYQVVVGTRVADRRGNRLSEPVQLVFATGSQIDSGKIVGKVWQFQGEGWWVMAHQDDPPVPDTLIHRKPAYFLPLSQQGSFQIEALSIRRYLLFALQDANGDRQYQVGENIALPPFWIALTDKHPMMAGIYLRPIQEDFQPPQLQQVKTPSLHTVQLVFNEPVVLSTNTRVWIQDSLTHQPLNVLGMAILPDYPNILALFTEPQQERRYLGWIWHVADSSGNNVDSIAVHFSGSNQPDTLSPKIIRTFPPDGAENVSYSAIFQLTANQPLDTHRIATQVWLVSGMGDTVSGHWDFSNLYQPLFYPDTLLAKGQRYQLTVSLPLLRTLWGEPLGDSLLTVRFTTIDWAELGEIEGIVQLPDSFKRYPVVVEAVATTFKDAVTFRTRMQESGKFFIPFLPEGYYYLQAFVDRNNNGRWDGGRSKPFQFAEPFTVVTDTLRVRKRWTTQGAIIRFY